MSDYGLKYQWAWHVYQGELTNELEECRMCQAEVPLRNYPLRNTGLSYQPDEDPRYLCELCASTYAGNAHQYPDQYKHCYEMMQIVNHGNNMILLQMGKWGAPGMVPTLNPNREQG